MTQNPNSAPIPYPDSEEPAQPPVTPEPETTIAAPPPTPAQAARYSYANMIREVRSWGFWMLGMAVIQLFVAQTLFSPWALLQVTIGLASFYFRTSAMFMVYTVVLFWAALSNLLSGSGGWGLFSLFQVFLGFQVLRDFNRYRRAEAEYRSRPLGQDDPQPGPDFFDRGSKIFPISGCLVGALAGAGAMAFFLLFVGAIVIGANGSAVPGWLEPVAGGLVGLTQVVAVLGVGINLGSLLVKYPERVFAWLGLSMSLLISLLYIILMLVNLFG
jgi:hypothetical protein